MHILFIGQRGIPTLSREALRERRVEALAVALAEEGHAVTVSCAQPFASRSIGRFNDVQLRHLVSFNPAISGGWLHTLLELALVWRSSSDVVHLHGWRLAVLSPIAVLLKPDATFVWTVDAFPKYSHRLLKIIARWAVAVCDVTTVPTRQLQYRLLNDLGVKTHYVPDGYHPEEVPGVAASRFGLRKGQYALLLATTPREVRFAAKAYRKAATRKKLVVLQEARGPFKRLATEFPFLHFVGAQQRRAAVSLINQAAAGVVVSNSVPQEMVLQAMHGGMALVAVSQPHLAEVLGVSARFVAPGDVAGMTEALNDTFRSKQKQAAWGAKARRRSQHHFRWPRIVREYLELYHYPVLRSVLVDSARPSFAQARTAQ